MDEINDLKNLQSEFDELRKREYFLKKLIFDF